MVFIKNNQVTEVSIDKGIWSVIEQRKLLEPSCCKKRQKSLNQETGEGNRGHLKVLNNTKLILNVVTHAHLVSFRTFRRPLFPKLVSWLGLFLPLLTARHL